jgi:hypothetical protein
MHQSNEIPNRVAFAEVQRQLKEATGGLDTDVRAIRPIKLRREWVICMTRFAAEIANKIWTDQENGGTDTSFYFTLEKFPDIPIFNLGKTLKVRVDLLPMDTPVTWDSCVWQPSE